MGTSLRAGTTSLILTNGVSHQERASELKIEARYDDGYLYQLKRMVLGLSCQIHATYRKVRNLHSKIKVGSRIVPLQSLTNVGDLAAHSLRKQTQT